MLRSSNIALLACVVCLVFTPTLSAAMLTLSDLSDPGTTLPERLDASIEIIVDDLNDVLTLIFDNDTTGADPFDVNEIYFNASDNIVSFSFSGILKKHAHPVAMKRSGEAVGCSDFWFCCNVSQLF